jgi:hypothetical protein
MACSYVDTTLTVEIADDMEWKKDDVDNRGNLFRGCWWRGFMLRACNPWQSFKT